MARKTLSPRCDLRRHRDQLLALLGGGGTRRAVPARRGRRRDPHRADRGRRLRLAHLPPRRAARAALRLPGPRPLRPGHRQPLQPGEVPARSVREGHRRPDRRRSGAVLLRLRRPGQLQRRGLARAHDDLGGHQPLLRLGLRPSARSRVPPERDLRGAREGADHAAPGRARGAARHLHGHDPSGHHRAPGHPRHHRHRADAGAPVRQRPHPRREGAVELLGLQHHRLLRPAQRLRGLRHPGPAGAGVQIPGQGDARGGHRGHPRRGLQPHRRGQPPRPHLVLSRHRQRRLLPPGRRRPHPLLRHHRHRQFAADAPPPRAAADHGQPALLGRGHARRRLPLRPGLHPRPPVPRGRPALLVLHADPAGPGALPGEADRRALGRRRRWLPGRRLPAAVDRVERQVPRHRA